MPSPWDFLKASKEPQGYALETLAYLGDKPPAPGDDSLSSPTIDAEDLVPGGKLLALASKAKGLAAGIGLMGSTRLTREAAKDLPNIWKLVRDRVKKQAGVSEGDFENYWNVINKQEIPEKMGAGTVLDRTLKETTKGAEGSWPPKSLHGVINQRVEEDFLADTPEYGRKFKANLTKKFHEENPTKIPVQEPQGAWASVKQMPPRVRSVEEYQDAITGVEQEMDPLYAELDKLISQKQEQDAVSNVLSFRENLPPLGQSVDSLETKAMVGWGEKNLKTQILKEKILKLRKEREQLILKLFEEHPEIK